MQPNNAQVPKLNPGAMAIYELLAVRSFLHEWPTPPSQQWSANLMNNPTELKQFDDCVFFSNMAGTVERGLPQFKAPDPDDRSFDVEDNRVCTVNELFDLASDLVEAGDMTKKRADSLNQAFENMTGHSTLIDWHQEVPGTFDPLDGESFPGSAWVEAESDNDGTELAVT